METSEEEVTVLSNLIELYRKKGYRNLHLHTDGSHLDGMNDIPSLMKRLKEIGHTACSITDHGNLHQVFRFYQQCLVNDIKPVLGFEAYVATARQLQKKSDFMIVEDFLEDDFVHEISHLVMLAETFEGYQNLCRLTTLSGSEGFYGKPRIDYELLRKYKEGVIVINGHVGTDIAKAFERACNPIGETSVERKAYSENEVYRAYELNKWYKEVFGDNYYLEIQNHGLNIEAQINPLVIKLAEDSGVKLVMTNDSHYTWREDADTHRIHFANGLGQFYDEFMNGNYEGFTTCDEFYVKSDEEMLEMAIPFGDVAIQALINTQEVIDRCNVKIEAVDLQGTFINKKGKLEGKWKTKEYLFPEFPIPAPFNTKEAYFEHLAMEGLKDRIANEEVDLDEYTLEDYQKRLKYEMEVINNMGFPTYFIILWDVLKFCIDNDIPVGKGRGSGAGSLVAYSLRITDIDPLHYKLLFERFLNPHRISMPDIDLDFCYDRIQEVIDYTKEKYGHDKVCKIGTYGTLSAKAVIKDVGRVLRYDFHQLNSLTKKVTEIGIKIKDILKQYSDFQKLYDEDPDFKRIIDSSLRLEGLQRHTSQHAAGIIISPFPLTDLIPLKGKGGDLTAQFDMVELEALGFVKMDYLRLRTLTVIKNATNSIDEQLGEFINIDKIDFNDQKVFEKFQEGESLGIFQFESEGMQSLLKKQKPTSIEDLSAVNALYRPGPLDYIIEDQNDPNFGKTMVDVYLARASGEQEVVYDHPLLEPIQEPTYGVFVYQEQVMFASVALAGFTLPESDELRKVVGKKLLDKMPEQKEKFVNGCMDNNEFTSQCESPKELAERIWGQIETFGRYGFNKSHATAYATLAYQSMWLKTYYPEFFMASVLTSLIGDKIEKIIPYLNECRRLNLQLLAPDVNQSTLKFEVSSDRKGIHFSLNGIKGVGTKAVENILEVKKKHAFKTLSDFIMMTGSAVNKTVIVALAQAGAFDFLGYNRRTMVKVAEDLVAISSKVKQKISANKRRKNPVQDISTFYEPFYTYEVEILDEFTHDELCKMEKDLTGFYMTHHPLEGLIDYIQSKVTHTAESINLGIPIEKMVPESTETEEGEVRFLYDVDSDEIEYEQLPPGQFVITGGVIKQVKEITIKRGANQGKTMASVVIEDAYQGDIRCTIFQRQYEQYSNIIKEGSIIFIKGNVDYFNDNAQVNVKTIEPVSRESAKNLLRHELSDELRIVQTTIREIEETIELLGDDADLIVDITSELFKLYDKQDELRKQLQEVEFAS